MCRHKALEGVVSDVSPIHWQYGAIARLKKGETIDKYLHNGYSTMSLGYIGLYETTYLMKGCSQTVEPGKEFALRVMDYMKERCAKWKEETGIAFSLYGTPAETLCYRFARIDRENTVIFPMSPIRDITQIPIMWMFGRRSTLSPSSRSRVSSRISRWAELSLTWKYQT